MKPPSLLNPPSPRRSSPEETVLSSDEAETPRLPSPVRMKPPFRLFPLTEEGEEFRPGEGAEEEEDHGVALEDEDG